jgi:hypothetical protein
VIVAVTAVPPVLTAVKDGGLPVPVAARPIEVFEFVQLNVEPAGVLLRVTEGAVEPLQTVTGATVFTVGTGFTVTVAIAVPAQVPVVPVTV